jgi:BirA family biotin operon repressor/biotin-[acetyl-CoA-carboxylase] ligase
MSNPEFTQESLQRTLAGTLFGSNVRYYPVTGSTNVEAHTLARGGAPEGTLVLAEEQTAGRGRRGRSWVAPAGSSLLFSLLFRPGLPPDRAQYLTMLCSLAILDAVTPLTGTPIQLKWPNDLVSGTRKLAGILTEVSAAGSRLDYVIVGIGLNVNWRPETAPELQDIATGLSLLAGHSLDRLPLLVDILRGVEARYRRLQAGESPQLEWARRLATLGKPVTVQTATGDVSGFAESVDETGALIVRTSDGRSVSLLEGDVVLAHREPPVMES